jgi:hypothetical protein
MFSLLHKIKANLAVVLHNLRQPLNQPLIEQEVRALKAEIRSAMPTNPVLNGALIYAQCDEDGIILDILARLGKSTTLSKTVLEFGASNGLENMTHSLILSGFVGYWVEGSPEKVEFVRTALGGLDFSALKVIQKFVTLENVRDIVADAEQKFGTRDIDLLSMDLDGNDLHILQRALETLKPKLIAVEYNGKFPPPMSLTVTYDATHTWQGDDYYGASLQKYVDTLKDYVLVSCNLSGVNAFFVRKDIMQNFDIYPVHQLFQPARHYLIGLSRGHRASLKHLREYLRQAETGSKSA